MLYLLIFAACMILSIWAKPKSDVVNGNREIFYEIPTDMNKAVGLLIVLPGCGHNAKDWWLPSDCSSCIGLPVEVSMMKKFVKRNYITAVLSPKGQCFSPAEDMYYLTAAIDFMKKTLAISDKFPVYLYGISGGGSFARYAY